MQVLSARQSLTSVFGMGTGGPSASITPTFVAQDIRRKLLVFALAKFRRTLGEKSNLKRKLAVFRPSLFICLRDAPSGIRTRDPLIKSQLLYQLS